MSGPLALDGKCVVVIGGAGLLGRAFCKAASAAGARVAVADRNEDVAAKVAAELTSHGAKAAGFGVDIASAESIDQLLTQVESANAPIDGMINTAYPRTRSWGASVDVVSYADFCENLSLQLGGAFLVMQRFARYFKGRGGGSIVNLGSIYGSLAPRFDIYEGTSMTTPPEYPAIKGGLNQLTRYFAQVYKKDGVRCNVLSPGGILDGQPDSFLERYAAHAGVRGMLLPEDVAGSAVFLLSEASRHVTGQNLVADDGFSL